MARPMSAVTGTYVCAVAPLMTTPLRSHEIVVRSGEPVKPPLLQVSVEPTAGVPETVGGATGTGTVACSSDVATWMCRSCVDLLPALSTASAVRVIVWLTAELGGV